MLEKKEITFTEARKLCEQSDDLCAATNAGTPVLFHRQSTKPLRDAPNVHNSAQVSQVPRASRIQPKAATNRCFSGGEYHLRSTCRFHNSTCHAYGKMGHIRKCFDNVGGMKVQSVKLEVDGKTVFLKRRVLPYVQREGVLKALQKVKQNGMISKVESSAWATPIIMAMKIEGRTPRNCGYYRLTLNPRLRRCAVTTMEPEDCT
ncbi:unnamed protein product [Echinostoma caproni]|uniref:Reverse transcriptase domain-containing protein n=1 Tax=Echinostoma caproni TaxID=27848 RepID=A0A183BFN4_9TREM|nr:unnamed protein product [Echinostoma caproni]